MLIGISGKKASGKDAVGRIIQGLTGGLNISEVAKFTLDKNHHWILNIKSDWQIKKFADKLKYVTCLLLSCTREQLEDGTFKNKKLPPNWWYYKGEHGNLIPFEDNNPRNDKDLIKLTPRKVLQLLGTECGRDILHPNIWINSLLSNYTSSYHNHIETGIGYPNWIITDCRFPNEIEAIKQRKGLLIRVESKRCDYNDKHSSETALDNYEKTRNGIRTNRWDKVISTDGYIEDLIKEVKQFLIKKNLL